MDDQDVGGKRQIRNGGEVADGIVGQLHQADVDRYGCDVADHQRVAIRRRFGRQVHADRAACTASVIDDERLSPALGELLIDRAGEQIRATAGRQRHDEPNRLRRKACLFGMHGREYRRECQRT